MSKTRIDLASENFDRYFADNIPKLTPEAKDGLPKDILFKLFRKGGEFNSNSTSKLNFIAKLYILVKCLKKRWYIIVEDEDYGMRLQDFNDLPRLIKERNFDIADGEDLKTSGGFILGANDLMNGFAYLNRLSSSPAYNYILSSKNAPKNKAIESDKKDQYLIRFLINYEGVKKVIVSQTGLNMPELYVLMALYHGNEAVGATFYNDLFKRAYQSSPAKIKLAFGSLQQRGYIHKYGVTRGARLQITALGKDTIRGILDKYLVNL